MIFTVNYLVVVATRLLLAVGLQMADSSKSDGQPLCLSKVLSAETHAIVSLSYNDDMLLCGSDSGVLLLWSKEQLDGTGQYLTLDVGMTEAVNYICHVTCKQWLVACGEAVMFITQTSNQLTKTHTLQMTEEVNSIDVNEKRTYAAVADDSGHLTIVDLKTRKIYKRLLKHENICSCVKFRPKSPWSVVTAGLDCILNLWNFSKGQVIGSVNMTDAQSTTEENKDSYVVNPPLIHSLALSLDGLITAAGLENGKVHLYTIGGKGFKLASIVDAHNQGVSVLCINQENKLISGGNDSHLNIYNLSTARAPGKTLVWATLENSATHTDKPSSFTEITGKRQIVVADETNKLALYCLSG